MNVNGVDNLLAQMRAAMALAQGGAMQKPEAAAAVVQVAGGQAAGAPTDFAAVLKSSLDSVAEAQNHAEAMQHAFVMGDEKVSLSDVMIDMQKASISFQSAVQVRNKVIAAYNDIMNMSV